MLSTGDSSTTIGEREVAKVRANEFTKLKVGQFAFPSDGNSEIIKFRKPTIEHNPLKEINNMANVVQSNMDEILSDMETFAVLHGISQVKKT